MKYYLSIDAGTSVIKVVIFNINFNKIISSIVKTPVVTNSSGKSELLMTKFWELTASCIYDTIKRSKINPKNIAGVGVTGNMVVCGQ